MTIEHAIDVLKTEADGILKMIDRIDREFTRAVDTIYHSKGRLIVSGIGKPGIVGRKIVATLNSTGTRSFILHPVEAMHGDLGMVSRDDVLMALSNSGETEELNSLVLAVRKLGCVVIALTGNTASTLAKNSDITIDVGVEKEACPLGLAPMASTTALLAMGDALAAVLIDKRQFKPSDFRRYHPGGALGQRLSQMVEDIMLTGRDIPLVPDDAPMSEAIVEMNRPRQEHRARPNRGVVFVIDAGGLLVGLIGDGDLRRCLASGKELAGLSVRDIMTSEPLTVCPDVPAYDALNVMEQHEIYDLPVIDKSGKVVGILELHDILGKGEFKFNGR